MAGREQAMDVVHPRCTGIDISEKDAKVCLRIAGAGRREAAETGDHLGSVSRQILASRDHLVAAGMTCLVMEATGNCWKPFTTCSKTCRGGADLARQLSVSSRQLRR